MDACSNYVISCIHLNKISFYKLLIKIRFNPAFSYNPSFLFGEWIAQKILDSRKKDGEASTTINYIGSEQPGQWRRTPPHFRPPEQPNWGNLKPFASNPSKSFLPSPPPSFDSQEYYDAVKEVKIYGANNSYLRTKDQTESAKFWKDFSYIYTSWTLE